MLKRSNLRKPRNCPWQQWKEERSRRLSPMVQACDFRSTGAWVCLLYLQTFTCGNTVRKLTVAHWHNCAAIQVPPAALCMCGTGETRGPHGAPQVRAWERRGRCPLWPPAVSLLEKLPRFCFKKSQNQLNKCIAIWCSVSMQFRLIVQLHCKD